MIVVDSNILAYLYLPSDFTIQAEQLLLQDVNWVAPRLWRSEFRNILAGYMRRGTLTLNQAHALQFEAENLLYDREFELDSLDVLTLVKASECSAYDCEFVALAKKLDIKLVTMDKKVLKNFPQYAVSIEGTAH